MPTYPVTRAGASLPVISNPWNPPGHEGVDIMFHRLATDPPYKKSDPRGTEHYYVPVGTLSVSTQPGRVVYAKWAWNGWRVRVATPDGWEELHLHLEGCFVHAGDSVLEGQPLGVIGGDPSADDAHHTVHLHFERRLGNVPYDPANYLQGLPAVEPPSHLPPLRFNPKTLIIVTGVGVLGVVAFLVVRKLPTWRRRPRLSPARAT